MDVHVMVHFPNFPNEAEVAVNLADRLQALAHLIGEDALDEAVIDACFSETPCDTEDQDASDSAAESQASEINNGGYSDQVEYLRSRGFSDTAILDAACIGYSNAALYAVDGDGQRIGPLVTGFLIHGEGRQALINRMISVGWDARLDGAGMSAALITEHD